MALRGYRAVFLLTAVVGYSCTALSIRNIEKPETNDVAEKAKADSTPKLQRSSLYTSICGTPSFWQGCRNPGTGR